jgi:hypothetical protein
VLAWACGRAKDDDDRSRDMMCITATWSAHSGGLEGLLEEHSSKDLPTRHAIMGGDLGRVMYLIVVEPCRVGDVEEVEEVRGVGRGRGERGAIHNSV